MSHWTVIKQDDMYCDGEDVLWGPRWCVKSPTGVGWGNYATHAEALAYADKRARTREVVLPRVNDATFIDENNLDLMVVSVDNGIGISQPNFDKPGEDEVIIMYPEVAEEVALALLAHAERMSQ